MSQPLVAAQARLNWARAGFSKQAFVERTFPAFCQGFCHQGRQVKTAGREAAGVGGNRYEKGPGRPDATCVGQMHPTPQGTCREPVLTILCSPNLAGELVLKEASRPDDKGPAIGKGKALPPHRQASVGGARNLCPKGRWRHVIGFYGRLYGGACWIGGVGATRFKRQCACQADYTEAPWPAPFASRPMHRS